jgi:hypothetical protein
MTGVISLRYRRVLWGTAIAACLLAGLVVILSKVSVPAPEVARASRPLWRERLAPAEAADRAYMPSRSAAVLPRPSPESRTPNPGFGPVAQPRLVEAYGKLPLSFAINRGQADPRVKFLSRGSGYSQRWR